MTRSSLTAIIVAMALSGLSRPASAQFFGLSGGAAEGNIEGFTVVGKGMVSAKPNRLEIDVEVSAASELTADAIVKYRDAKRRLQEAFTTLKLANVTVEERGMNVAEKGAQFNPYFFDGQPNRKAKAEVQITRKLIINCTEIRSLDEEALLQLVAKLLDVAQDAGGKVGPHNDPYAYYYYGRANQPAGLVRFILDDYEKLEEEAYGKAIADAETRAQRLAKLSHVKLGGVTAVREAPTAGDRSMMMAMGMGMGTDQNEETPKKRLESAKFQAIPIRIELLVRFDAAANRPATANQPALNGRAGE